MTTNLAAAVKELEASTAALHNLTDMDVLRHPPSVRRVYCDYIAAQLIHCTVSDYHYDFMGICTTDQNIS